MLRPYLFPAFLSSGNEPTAVLARVFYITGLRQVSEILVGDRSVCPVREQNYRLKPKYRTALL